MRCYNVDPLLQVGLNESCALDAKKGARAMLIKNCKGDWGLVISQWTGYVKGKEILYIFYKCASEQIPMIAR